MAVCGYCKQEMLEADGCLFTHVKINGRWRKRNTSCWQQADERCGDCGAKYGKQHHVGCDIERCPRCGLQAISCDCKVTMYKYQKESEA